MVGVYFLLCVHNGKNAILITNILRQIAIELLSTLI